MPRYTQNDPDWKLVNPDEWGMNDGDPEPSGWVSVVLFALVFVAIGAGITVVVTEWII